MVRSGAPGMEREGAGSARGGVALRRRARAPSPGGRGPVPDAVAVRALRLEPDVCDAVRRGPGLPRDRRTGRYRRGFSTALDPRGPRDRLSVPALRRGRVDPSAAARPGGPSRSDGMAATHHRGHADRLRVGTVRGRIRPRVSTGARPRPHSPSHPTVMTTKE